MRYAYSETGEIINGVMVFFEKGDTEIAIETFKVINASTQRPTSIIWNGTSMTPSEALSRLRKTNALDEDFLGVRFTVEDGQLLKDCLEFFKDNYPAIESVVQEINMQVFGGKPQ
jgi:hypothetical protein